jgi:ABC-type hemin transport system ATPase subunit
MSGKVCKLPAGKNGDGRATFVHHLSGDFSFIFFAFT